MTGGGVRAVSCRFAAVTDDPTNRDDVFAYALDPDTAQVCGHASKNWRASHVPRDRAGSERERA
jgi:hypothetical protein